MIFSLSISSHSVVLMYIYLYTSILRPARLAANQRFPFFYISKPRLIGERNPDGRPQQDTHTHTKRIFFSSSFFLFWIKKGIINTIKEIYIKKSHFFTIFKWCPLLRNFIHETCVIFSPLLLILYRMFFLSLFHVVQWIWNMNRHSMTAWVAMVTRWFWRFSLLFHSTTRILFNLSYVHTSSKKGRKYRVRYGFWGQSIGRNICLSLFLKVIQDWQFFFLPSIYRHLL